MADVLTNEPSVFQVENNEYRYDIAPSYHAAMHRMLYRATEHKKYGERVSSNFTAFSDMDVRAHCDPTMSAIRYAVAIIPEQFAIAEHRLRCSPAETSLHRLIDVMTEFDPTFDILLHLHCIAIGQLNLRKATKEVITQVATGVKRTVWSLRSAEVAFEHLRDVQFRNGGIDFLSGGMTPDQLVSELPGLVRDRFAVMAEAVVSHATA